MTPPRLSQVNANTLSHDSSLEAYTLYPEEIAGLKCGAALLMTLYLYRPSHTSYL